MRDKVRNFKIGDRVMIISSIGIDEVVPIGSEGIIGNITDYYHVRFDCDKTTTWLADDSDLIGIAITKD